MIGFEPQLKRLRMQLADAIRKEAALAPYPEQDADQEQLATALRNLDTATDQVFALAKTGNERQARALIVGTLRPQRESLSQRVSRMLIQNNELDQQTAGEIERIYTGVERDIYIFLLAALAAIIVTAVAVAYTNRRIFEQIASLSEHKSVLARKLISVQEEVLRSVSRELHDEFGQIFYGHRSHAGSH